MSDQGWIDANVAELPLLTLKHIHQYFITGRLRKDRVTATKPFKREYRLFDSKKVQGLSVHDVNSTSVYCIIRATVLPSQKAGAYKTAITVNKTNGQIIYGSCTCVAGSSACNHTAAVMFAVDDIQRSRATHGNSGGPSLTSLPRKWGVTARPKNEPIPVQKLEVTKPKYGKVSQHTHPSDIQPVDPKLSTVSIRRVMSLRDDLQRNCTDKILFRQDTFYTSMAIRTR